MACKITIFLQANKVLTSCISDYFLSSFKNECNSDCSIDNRTLNSIAIQMLSTLNPDINWSAKSIISALTTNKNNPKVRIVIGNVRITNIGFIIKFKIDKTTATIIAVVYESTCTPLSIFASTTTAIAFSKRRIMSFIISVLN